MSSLTPKIEKRSHLSHTRNYIIDKNRTVCGSPTSFVSIMKHKEIHEGAVKIHKDTQCVGHCIPNKINQSAALLWKILLCLNFHSLLQFHFHLVLRASICFRAYTSRFAVCSAFAFLQIRILRRFFSDSSPFYRIIRLDSFIYNIFLAFFYFFPSYFRVSSFLFVFSKNFAASSITIISFSFLETRPL